MIPYKDDNPTERFPYFTVAFIALNVLVFIYEVLFGMERVVYTFGAVPASLMSFKSAQPLHPMATVFTAMFLHGGLFHLAGNMLYLWIFGNNIEDKLGHARFVFFYLFCGVVAAYAHAFSDPSSPVPMVGASGAVSGVLGAYILLFPRAQVYTVIFLGFFVQVVRLPALIVIGFWAIIQFVSGFLEKGVAGHGGVAWFAHVGGFLVGLLSVKLLTPRRRRTVRW